MPQYIISVGHAILQRKEDKCFISGAARKPWTSSVLLLIMRFIFKHHTHVHTYTHTRAHQYKLTRKKKSSSTVPHMNTFAHTHTHIDAEPRKYSSINKRKGKTLRIPLNGREAARQKEREAQKRNARSLNVGSHIVCRCVYEREWK